MTERNCIAIGVDQDDRIWKGHFGMSPQYKIYDRNGEFLEERQNPYGVVDGLHKHHDNPKLIVDLLPECNVFIAQRMGGGSKRKLAEKLGIQAVFTEEKDPQLALSAYFESSQN